jgi:hypothetical protein
MPLETMSNAILFDDLARSLKALDLLLVRRLERAVTDSSNRPIKQSASVS